MPSALPALKLQLDKRVVPGYLFGFAELPQDPLPSSVQRWCEAASTPGVWKSTHQMQLPAALAHHIHASWVQQDREQMVSEWTE